MLVQRLLSCGETQTRQKISPFMAAEHQGRVLVQGAKDLYMVTVAPGEVVLSRCMPCEWRRECSFSVPDAAKSRHLASVIAGKTLYVFLLMADTLSIHPLPLVVIRKTLCAKAFPAGIYSQELALSPSPDILSVISGTKVLSVKLFASNQCLRVFCILEAVFDVALVLTLPRCRPRRGRGLSLSLLKVCTVLRPRMSTLYLQEAAAWPSTCSDSLLVASREPCLLMQISGSRLHWDLVLSTSQLTDCFLHDIPAHTGVILRACRLATGAFVNLTTLRRKALSHDSSTLSAIGRAACNMPATSSHALVFQYILRVSRCAAIVKPADAEKLVLVVVGAFSTRVFLISTAIKRCRSPPELPDALRSLSELLRPSSAHSSVSVRFFHLSRLCLLSVTNEETRVSVLLGPSPTYRLFSCVAQTSASWYKKALAQLVLSSLELLVLMMRILLRSIFCLHRSERRYRTLVPLKVSRQSLSHNNVAH